MWTYYYDKPTCVTNYLTPNTTIDQSQTTTAVMSHQILVCVDMELHQHHSHGIQCDFKRSFHVPFVNPPCKPAENSPSHSTQL